MTGRISLAGKDPAAVKAEIRKAARSVCSRMFDSSFAAFYGQELCVRSAVRRAEAQLPPAYASRKTETLASVR